MSKPKPRIGIVRRDEIGGTMKTHEDGDAMFKVYAERCDQCLFSPDKIVSNSRRADILRECKRRDSHFVCHKASMNGQDVSCRGFFDTQTSNLIRIMGRLNCIEFVPLPSKANTNSK